MEIRELTTAEEFQEAYLILTQLYGDLDKDRFERELPVMREEGYRLFGGYEDDALRCLAGANVVTNFANGKHVYLYDLVTDEAYRSRGYGRELLQFLEQWGTNEAVRL